MHLVQFSPNKYLQVTFNLEETGLNLALTHLSHHVGRS